jgi:hypothetical protein
MPSPVISLTSLTGSALLVFNVSVAPISRAISSFDATVSIAMMCSAPASVALSGSARGEIARLWRSGCS